MVLRVRCASRHTGGVDGEPVVGDAFGAALLDRFDGAAASIVVERDDGFVAVEASDYFADPGDDPLWQWLRPRMGPRVLDLGAGAGRAALVLQREDVDVVALDISAGCIDVCRRRGVRSTFHGTLEELSATAPAPFDTVLGLGNNLGLIGSPEAAAGFFSAAKAIGAPDVRLVGTMLDPYLTDDPVHLRYHERNRAARRPPGNIRIRVRYRNQATDWFELLWLSPAELGALAREHGWDLVATRPQGILYGAELRIA